MALRGHAFGLLDEAMTFLMRHLPIRGRFEPNRLERIDEPLFPTAALREALVNALCHRDYSIPGGAVNVAVFDDRLEIWSAAGGSQAGAHLAAPQPLSRDELQAKLGLQHRESFRKLYLVPALASGLIERTIPDRPRSRLQKYRLTDKGRAWVLGQG